MKLIDTSSKQDLIELIGYWCPKISPDGKTLATINRDMTSVQLWDLPIRKPIGKILGLAGLAVVATLLAFKGLGWLRRKRYPPSNTSGLNDASPSSQDVSSPKNAVSSQDYVI